MEIPVLNIREFQVIIESMDDRGPKYLYEYGIVKFSIYSKKGSKKRYMNMTDDISLFDSDKPILELNKFLKKRLQPYGIDEEHVDDLDIREFIENTRKYVSMKVFLNVIQRFGHVVKQEDILKMWNEIDANRILEK